MTEKEDENKKLMRRIAEDVWNEGRLDAVDERYTDDFVADFVGIRLLHGRDEYKR